MSTITDITEPSTFSVSPRRVLRPGMSFRTLRGSGPTFRGASVGDFGVFRCLRFYRRGQGGRRLYYVAIHERTGATHDLYLEGPAFTSPTGTRERPYRIKLTPTPQARPR